MKYKFAFGSVAAHLLTINLSAPEQNDRRFAEDIFGCNFFNEKLYILMKIALRFVHKGPIDNNPALFR